MMRADMSKIIVERPRRGSRQRNVKSALSLDPARLDNEVYIDPPTRRPIDYSNRKYLNENLAPLRRYLERNVGRPWSKVYSEIRATLDCRKATGLHILQHLTDFVTVDTWFDGKTVMGAHGYWGVWPVSGIYVHPVSKLLRRAPVRRWKRRLPSLTEIQLDPLTFFRLVGKNWFRFEYAQREPKEIVEVVRFHEDQPDRNREHGLKAPGDRKIIRYRDLPPEWARYLVRQRQCNREELAEIERRLCVSARKQSTE